MTEERIDGLTAAVRKLKEHGGRIRLETASLWCVLNDLYVVHEGHERSGIISISEVLGEWMWEPPKPAETSNLTAQEAARMLFEKGGEIEGPGLLCTNSYCLSQHNPRIVHVDESSPNMGAHWFSDERCWVHREAPE